MAKKGGSGSSPAAEAQARIAQQLFMQTDPIRSGLINRSAAFLGAPAAGGMKDGGGGALTEGFAAGAGGGIAGVIESLTGGGRVPTPGVPGGATAPATNGFGDVTATPTFQAFRDSTNQNFNKARDKSISSLAPGGALTESLVNLEGQKASTLTHGAGSIYEDELSRAMALGTGITGTSMNSLGQAAATQAAIAQANADRDAGKSGMLGSGVGAVMGKK